LVYPYLGAFLASISTAFARVLTGFQTTKAPEGYDTNFYGVAPYFYVALLVFAAVSSYIIINKGLRHFDSVYIAPLFKIGGMLHNLMTGGIVFNEFSEYAHDPFRFGCFLTGIGI